MKLGSGRVLNAMNWPDAAVVREMFCLCWMPVTGFENRLAAIQKLFHQFIQWRDDLISVRHGQRAAGTEIILHIYHYQCFLFFVWHIEPNSLNTRIVFHLS